MHTIHALLFCLFSLAASSPLPYGLLDPQGQTTTVVAVYTSYASLVGTRLSVWEAALEKNASSFPQPTAGIVDALAHIRAHTAAWRKCNTSKNESVVVWPSMFPVLDRESDFVHMHPAQFDVNIDVYRACGIRHYLGPITLTQEASGHSVARLEAAADLHLLLTNAIVRPDDPWFLSVLPMWTDLNSNTTFLSLRDSTATGAADPVPATLSTVRFAWQSTFVTRRIVVFFNDRVMPVVSFVERVISMQQGDPLRYPRLPEVIFHADGEGAPVIRRTVGNHTLWVVRMALSRTSDLASARIELDRHGAIVAVTSAHVDLWDRATSAVAATRRSFTKAMTNTSTAFQTAFVETAPPDLAADPEYAAQQAVIAPYAARAIAEGDTVLCNTTAMPAPRTGNRGSHCQSGDCPMGRLFAEALQWSPQLGGAAAPSTDVAFLVGGGFRSEWAAGPLRASYLWLAMPFYNTVCYGKLRGATIARILALTVTGNFDTATDPREITLLQLAGLRVVVAPTSLVIPPGNTTVVDIGDTESLARRQNRVVSISVSDPATGTFRPLDMGRLYTFASNSYLCGAQWPFSAVLSQSTKDEEMTVTDIAEHSAARGFLRVMNGETNRTYVTGGLADVYSFAGPASPRLFIPWQQSDCPPGTYWAGPMRYCAPCPSGTSQSRAGQITCENDTLNLTIPLSIALCGVVALFVAGIGAFLLYRHLRRTWSSRNADRAPRDGRLAVMFLDIERGPELWGMAPRSMSAAIATYQGVVRRCVTAHGAYEVKSIGDAFLVVATTPIAAVKVACAIQVELLKEHFPTAINEVYNALAPETRSSKCPSAFSATVSSSPLQRMARSTGAEPLSPDLPPTAESPGPGHEMPADDPAAVDKGTLWNGPRVRIGIHYGSPSVAYDAVHEGFEYHGPCVQAAAQIEAATFGGQVCVSAAVARALPPRQKRFTVDLVGYVTLPNEASAGVSEASHMAGFGGTPPSPSPMAALQPGPGASELFEVCPRELLHRRVYGRSHPETTTAPTHSTTEAGASRSGQSGGQSGEEHAFFGALPSPPSAPGSRNTSTRDPASRRRRSTDKRRRTRTTTEPVVPAVMPFVTQLFRALAPRTQDKMLDALCTAWQVPEGPPTARIAALVTRVAQATAATASTLSRANRPPTPCRTPDVSWGASSVSCSASTAPSDAYSEHDGADDRPRPSPPDQTASPS